MAQQNYFRSISSKILDPQQNCSFREVVAQVFNLRSKSSYRISRLRCPSTFSFLYTHTRARARARARVCVLHGVYFTQEREREREREVRQESNRLIIDCVQQKKQLRKRFMLIGLHF